MLLQIRSRIPPQQDVLISTIVPYGVYTPTLGQLVLSHGPAAHWLCCEVFKLIGGYVLPFREDVIPTALVEQYKVSGWMPIDFQFPIIGYCPHCNRHVDTLPRSEGKVCSTCFTRTLPPRDF